MNEPWSAAKPVERGPVAGECVSAVCVRASMGDRRLPVRPLICPRSRNAAVRGADHNLLHHGRDRIVPADIAALKDLPRPGM